MTAKWRKNGLIKPVSGIKLPNNLLFLDVEAFIKQENEVTVSFPFRFGTAIYNRIDKNVATKERKVFSYYSIDEFTDILLSLVKKRKTLHIFNHNVGFDIRVMNLPHILHKLGFTSEPPIINERLFIWRLRSDNGNIIFIDTANFAVQSVKKLGDDMNLPKLDIDLPNATNAELLPYCMRDTEIIEKFILTYLKFLHTNNLGKFQVSLASQALYSWRYRFMQQSIDIHDNIEVLALEREAYHGGRVECFKLGLLEPNNYYYLDINSMYPYIMRNSILPFKINSFAHNPPNWVLKHMIKSKYLIARVSLNTDEPVYSILQNNRLIFPIGRFSTVLHNAELDYALEHNHIVSCDDIAVYDSTLMFKQYVDFFYGVKKSAELNHDKSWRFIAKIFQNSLYGKFAQQDISRKKVGTANPNDIWRLTAGNAQTGARYQEIAWFGEIIREQKSGEATFSFPAIAGAITAEARMLLWKLISQAKRENVMYVDTDSLIVNQDGYNNLVSMIDEHELGMLKIEDTSTILELRGAKDYTFGDKSKTKGKSDKAVDLTVNRWQQLQFQSFLAWLNIGGNANPTATQTTKQRSGKYNKGNVNQDKPDITPFKLHQR